jgi:hypothetical protein
MPLERAGKDNARDLKTVFEFAGIFSRKDHGRPLAFRRKKLERLPPPFSRFFRKGGNIVNWVLRPFALVAKGSAFP